MNTEEIIAGMLTEEVATHFLDSGGTPQRDDNGKYIGSIDGYGRAFEINQGRDFASEDSSVVTFSNCNGKVGVSIEHNLYHWLVSRLEIAENLDAIFHGAFRQSADADKSWQELMIEFPSWVAENVGYEEIAVLDNPEKNMLCALNDAPLVVNSYNCGSVLSQTIVYVYFCWNNEVYIILQIHGGCDVRGGYTIPRVFKNIHDDETAIFDHANGNVYCTGKDYHPTALKIKKFQEAQIDLPGMYIPKIDFDCRVNWYTDDGCSFYEDGGSGDGYTNLENMNCVDLKAEIEEHEGEIGQVTPGDWRPGVICILDGKGYCPQCGALLGAGY
jgi:hypothetical protein